MNSYSRETVKGYFRVSLPPRRGYSKAEDFSHIDQFQNGMINGTMTFKMTTLTPVSFTQGDLIVIDGKLTHPLERNEGRVVMPGSSLKGAIRSYSSVLSGSCEDVTCPGSDGKLCLSCYLFGTMGKMGKVHFSDSFFDASTSERTAPVQWKGKSHGSKAKVYSHKTAEQSDRTISYEVIDTGNNIPFELALKGLKPLELGLLLLSMGIHPNTRFLLKVGRGKNLGFGSVLIEPDSACILKVPGEHDTLKGDKLKAMVNSCINKYLSFARNNLEKDVILKNLELLVRDSSELMKSEN